MNILVALTSLTFNGVVLFLLPPLVHSLTNNAVALQLPNAYMELMYSGQRMNINGIWFKL